MRAGSLCQRHRRIASPPGRFRSDDLLCFKQALLPTELPGEKARTEGLEPSLFGFVDRDVIQLHYVLKAESSGLEPQALNSICLANSAYYLIGLLSKQQSQVGRKGIQPPTVIDS